MKRFFNIVVMFSVSLSLIACGKVVVPKNESGQEDIMNETEAQVPDTKVDTNNPAKEENTTKVIVDFKAEIQDYTAEDGTVVLKSSFEYPVIQISGNKEATAKINKDLETEKQTFHASAIETSDTAKKDYQSHKTDEMLDFYAYESGAKIQLQRKDDNVISFSYLLWSDTGGAHNNYATIGLNYDTVTGNRLQLEDISVNSEKFKTFATGYLVKLAKSESYKNRLFEDYGEYLEGTLFNDDKWFFSNSGITFFADPYSLGPFAAGTIRFVLPYDEIEGLKPEYTYKGYFEREIPLGMEVNQDINGDGKEETIFFNVEYDDSYQELITFQIGKEDFSGEITMGFPNAEAYYIIDLDPADNYWEIVLMDNGLSDYPVTYFYRYLEDGSLKLIGTISDLWSSDSCYREEDGTIAGNTRLNLLQTWFAKAHWKLNNGKLEFIEEDIYYPEIDESVHNKILKNVTVYSTMDLSSKSVELTPEDGTVQFTATDNKNWVELHTEDARILYLYMEDFSGIPSKEGINQASEVFDQLIFAD